MTRLRHYVVPKTLEQSIGLWLLIIAILTIERPYATALMTLKELYGIDFSVRVLGAWCAVSGGLLIVWRRVGRLAFVLLFLPAILYSLCLTLSFGLSSTVGVWGSAFGIGFWVAILYMHARRVTLREQAAEAWI